MVQSFSTRRSTLTMPLFVLLPRARTRTKARRTSGEPLLVAEAAALNAAAVPEVTEISTFFPQISFEDSHHLFLSETCQQPCLGA